MLATLEGTDPADVRIGMPIRIGYVDIPDEGITMYRWVAR